MQPEDAQALAPSIHDKQTSRSHSINGRDDSQANEQKYRKLRLRFDALKLVRFSLLTTVNRPLPIFGTTAHSQKLHHRQTSNGGCRDAQWLQGAKEEAWPSNEQTSNQFHSAGIFAYALKLGRIKSARVTTHSRTQVSPPEIFSRRSQPRLWSCHAITMLLVTHSAMALTNVTIFT